MEVGWFGLGCDGIADLWLFDDQNITFNQQKHFFPSGNQVTYVTLSLLEPNNSAYNSMRAIRNVLPHVNKQESSALTMATTIVRFWTVGGVVSWAKLQGNNKRRRIGLFTYPFESLKHWIEPFTTESSLAKSEPMTGDVAEQINSLISAGEGQVAGYPVFAMSSDGSDSGFTDCSAVAQIF
jgi:acyl transferase domain-containing protein